MSVYVGVQPKCTVHEGNMVAAFIHVEFFTRHPVNDDYVDIGAEVTVLCAPAGYTNECKYHAVIYGTNKFSI